MSKTLNKKENQYTVSQGNYEKYIKISGEKQATCPQALEVRDNNAKYFIIEKNDEFYTDFCIYKEDNWLTLRKKLFLDNELLDAILPYITSEVNYFTCYIPLSNEIVYTAIKERFKNVSETRVEQAGNIFLKMKISLNGDNT